MKPFAAAAAAIVLVAVFSLTGTAQRAEQRSIDTRFALRGDRSTKQLAVVAIDERSIQQLDSWPLRRRYHAEAIDALRDAGARQIVYDVQFTEQSDHPVDDAMLYRAARGTVLATAESDGKGHTNVLGGDASLRRIHATAAAANMPGDTIRSYDARVSGLDSIASVVARRLGKPAPHGRHLIDFRTHIPTSSFVDVVNGDVPDVRGKIVVVGATAATLQDLHNTSIGVRPGPEIQANAIWTALHGNPLTQAPGWITYLMLVLLGTAGAALVVRLRPVAGAVAALALGAAVVVGEIVAFDAGLVLPAFIPLLGFALAVVAAKVAEAAAAAAARRRVVELEAAVAARTADLEQAHFDAMERLARAAELRDDDTGAHIDRMSKLCELVALEIGLGPARAEQIRRAARLHDVGKIGLPDSILRKPGPLTGPEIEVMRHHTSDGAEVLAGGRTEVMRMAEEIALTHHERWDGSGYPNAITGDDIPLEGRIAAVCDVYDALVSPRPYKRAWTRADACAEIHGSRGSHFDPAVADALLRVVGDTGTDVGFVADVRVQSDPSTSAAARSPERIAPSM